MNSNDNGHNFDVPVAALLAGKPRRDGSRRARRLDVSELRVLNEAEKVADVPGVQRPRTRGECEDGPRPCPWAGCRYHLYWDVNEETGDITYAFPDREPWELAETCALDVADRGPVGLAEIGVVTNRSRERVRQVEEAVLRKLRLHKEREEMRARLRKAG